MNNPKRKDQAADSQEDWAMIPFDEAEDDARWQRLIEETDELITEAKAIETNHGPLRWANKIADLKILEQASEDDLF